MIAALLRLCAREKFTNDPWGERQRQERNDEEGPPDLDEFFKKFFNFKKFGSFLVVGLLVVLALWLVNGFYTLPKGQLGIERRFGVVTRTVKPGWHWNWAFPVGSHQGFEAQNLRLQLGQNEDPFYGKTQAGQFYLAQATVDYEYSDLARYVESCAQPKILLGDLVKAAVRGAVKTQLQITPQSAEALVTSLNRELKTIGLGLRITALTVRFKNHPEHVQDAEAQALIAESQQRAHALVQKAQEHAAAELKAAQARLLGAEPLIAAFQRYPQIARAVLEEKIAMQSTSIAPQNQKRTPLKEQPKPDWRSRLRPIRQ